MSFSSHIFTLDFYDFCFLVCLTKTTSRVVTFMPPNHFSTRTLGFPLPSLEMKLVTVPPHYIATSTPARGEIYIRGPSVPQMGFYGNPEASASIFLDDGWIKTGDIGEWDTRHPGLKIIDRIKPLTQRFMGEYVPIERLERAYRASNVVNECCLIYSGKKTQPIAIISGYPIPLTCTHFFYETLFLQFQPFHQ